MLEAIRKAERHIHLQSYIIGNDGVGRTFLDTLAERAREGLRVRVLYDEFGSAQARLTGLFRRYRNIPNLQLVGFSQVNPIKRQFQLNLRNHRKLLIVDGKHGFTGGMNLYNVHYPEDRDVPGIRDYHFAVEGPIVLELQYTFLRDWYYMTDENAETLLSPFHFPEIDAQGTTTMRVVNAGPTDEREALCDVNFAMIGSARSQILLGTPYFVPPEDMCRALRVAGGLAAAGRREAVPVEGVVPDLRGVVEHATLRLAHDLFQRRIGELGAFDQLVEVVHIGLVVLAVVEVDGLAGDVRFQGGAVVGQGGQFDGHGSVSLC